MHKGARIVDSLSENTGKLSEGQLISSLPTCFLQIKLSRLVPLLLTESSMKSCSARFNCLKAETLVLFQRATLHSELARTA